MSDDIYLFISVSFLESSSLGSSTVPLKEVLLIPHYCYELFLRYHCCLVCVSKLCLELMLFIVFCRAASGTNTELNGSRMEAVFWWLCVEPNRNSRFVEPFLSIRRASRLLSAFAFILMSHLNNIERKLRLSQTQLGDHSSRLICSSNWDGGECRYSIHEQSTLYNRILESRMTNSIHLMNKDDLQLLYKCRPWRRGFYFSRKKGVKFELRSLTLSRPISTGFIFFPLVCFNT